MKAEHRKELQTNVLADRMGRLVQKIKSRPQGRNWLYAILALGVVLAIFLFFRSRTQRGEEQALAWVGIDEGYRALLDPPAGIVVNPDTKRFSFPANPDTSAAGRSARLQIAWIHLWELGVKRLAADWKAGLHALEIAEMIYDYLDKECQEDPIAHAEVLYAKAVIEETRAVQNPKNLGSARDMFAALAKKYPSTLYGKEAEKRAELLKENTTSLSKISEFYVELALALKVEPERDKEKR